jgi:hypothetical protein
MRAPFVLTGIVIATFVAGCSSDDDDTRPTPTRTATVAATATRTAAPSTATATAVVAPTNTATTAPTNTTAPSTSTSTAAPTATPTEPPTASATPSSTATATVTATTPPRAVARRITDAADLITGPLADGRVGDYLLANDVARFIIQDAPQRDLYSVGAFGGNIIDAELIGHPGLDNFLEIQPAVQVETVINAQSVEIVNDGSDGQAAIIRACGPDDVLDFVNPSTIIEDIGGLEFPAAADDQDYDIEGCTEYSLEVGKPYVRMVTTIMNNQDTELGLFVGDYLNAAGEVEQWTSAGAGIGEVLTNSHGVLSYIGFGEATGVDYSHVTVPLAGSAIPGSSFFTAAGVSYVMQSNTVINVILGAPPTFIVPANGSNSYTRYFGVGDGSGANGIDIENEVKGLAIGTVQGCILIGDQPAAAARVTIGPVTDGAIARVATTFVTGDDGCYAGTLTPGEYGVVASRRGAPYEGGGATPVVHPITVTAGETTEQDIALPATGRVRVTVNDERNEAVPARISVVGFDPSPEIRLGGTGLFNDPVEALPFGYAYIGYTDSSGVAEFDLEPGTYQLIASRGVEYSYFSQEITVTASATAPVQARIARVIDTTGFISSDYHVHGIASADSRVPDVNRVKQYSGEGVDNIIMTDHHAHTDLTPTITALGFTPFVRSTIGEEITTWDYGHFNAYPMLIDPTRASGGSTDWALAAEPGRDFKAYGAYSATPQEIEALAVNGALSTPDTVIQINHIDSHFDPLRIDTGLVPPQSFISPTDKLRYRLDPDSGNLFHPYKALEVWNGAGRGKQSEFLDLRLGIWFNHLNQGLITTAIGDTDSHEFLPLSAAGARTWTASPTDDPAAIDPADAARAVKAGRAVGGQGVYVQARLLAEDGSDAVADLALGGSTQVISSNRSVSLEIEAQAPIWAPFDRVEIYANATTVVTSMRDGVPTLYGAEPTLVLVAGQDFTLTRENVFPSIPGAERWTATLTVPFDNLERDTWFVAIVKGTDGVSQPMFPVMSGDISPATNQTLADLLDGNLSEGGVLALGYTNALYADVDGVAGFQAPFQP